MNPYRVQMIYRLSLLNGQNSIAPR